VKNFSSTSILIASVLKPVDDTRLYEKIGRSLASRVEFRVTIIGYPTVHESEATDVKWVMLEKFNRLSLKRWTASWKIGWYAWKMKPDVFLFSTHELLGVAVFLRFFRGVITIYDVQENYYRNILFTNAFPVPLRWPLACWVRLKEVMTQPFMQHYFLAERGYAREMTFFKSKFTVLENKALVSEIIPERKYATSSTVKLLFSGTLDASTGVFEAIRWAERLHAVDNRIRLTIIGFAARETSRERLNREARAHEWIELIGVNELVPHQCIVEAIGTADFGIVCYPLSKHIVNSIPTKVYEYLAYRLPMLLQQHPPWEKLCEPYRAAVIVPASAFSPEQVLSEMKGPFYTCAPQDVTWKSEEYKLLKVLHALTT